MFYYFSLHRTSAITSIYSPGNLRFDLDKIATEFIFMPVDTFCAVKSNFFSLSLLIVKINRTFSIYY